MTTNARKTDAQRLGNGKKAFNVKQVEKMVEDAGGSYTAGDGITIADNEISVDTTTIQEKLTAGDNITIVDDVISASGGGDFIKEETNNWAKYYDTTNGVVTDIIVSAYGGMLYIPKGYKLPQYQSYRLFWGASSNGGDGSIVVGVSMDKNQLFNDNAQCAGTGQRFVIHESPATPGTYNLAIDYNAINMAKNSVVFLYYKEYQ